MMHFLHISVVVVALSAVPAMAQSAYDRGYSHGYNDEFPAAGTPAADTEFGRGFNEGQDDSYEDDAAHQRLMDREGAGRADPLQTDDE